MPVPLLAAVRRRLRSLSRNPLALLLGLLAAMAASATVALVASLLAPSRPEGLRPAAQAYAVAALRVDAPPLGLRAGRGWLVPVEYRGRPVGLVLLTEGEYGFAPGGRAAERLEAQTGLSRIEDRFAVAFVAAGEAELASLLRRAGAQPLAGRSRHEAQRRAAAFLAAHQGWLDPLLAARPALGGPGIGGALLVGRDYGRVRVVFGPQVALRFVDLDDRTLAFPNPRGGLPDPSPLPGDLGAARLLVFLSTQAMLLSVAYVLTLDLPRRPDAEPLPPGELRWAWALLGLEAAVRYTAHALPLPGGVVPGLLYGLLAGLALARPPAAGDRLRALGLTRRPLARSLLLGAVLGTLGHLAATLALPQGVRETRPLAVAGLAAGSLLGALAVEAYRRGLLQRTLVARHGSLRGMALAAGLTGAAYALPAILARPAGWPDALLRGALAVPLAEALFAYLYHRTGSVVAGGLARGLMEFLARWLAA